MSERRQAKSSRSLPLFLVRTLSLFVIVWSALLQAGCGSPAATTANPLTLSSSRLDFGVTTANASNVSRSLALTNFSWAKVTVQSIAVSPAQVFQVHNWPGPVTLLPGQSINLQIVFTPRLAGQFTAVLSVAAALPTIPLSQPATGVTSSGTSASVQPVSWLGVPTGATSIVRTAALFGSATNGSKPPANPGNGGGNGNGNGGGNGGSSVNVAITPTSTSLSSGQSTQFLASVTGAANTAVTWSAALGTITSSGSYTAPGVTAQSMDTVTATSVSDTTKSASATVAVNPPPSAAAGPYTITNQQPTNFEFYPGSIYTTPLPADVGNHLLQNNGYGFSGDQIVQHIFGGSPANADYMLFRTEDASGGNYGGKPFHYSSESDPVYKVVSVSHAPSDPTFDPTGKYFHLTNQSCWNGLSGDQSNVWWDQSTDIDSTPGGRVLTSYYFNKGFYCLSNNPCHTTACADSTPAAQLNFYYAQMAYPGRPDAYAGTPSAWASMGVGPPAMFLRGNEIMAQSVNHALMVNTWCEASSVFVYPATESAGVCGVLANTATDQQRPVNGNLFWIDSGYNCNVLPPWQRGLCRTMQTYGAYLTDTGGNGTTNGIFISNSREGPRAYTDAGLRYPLFDWLAGQPGASCSGSPVNQCVVYTFNMPGLLSAVSTHLHIVDPCVVKRMAGLPGGC